MRIVTSHNDLSCSKVNVVLMALEDEVSVRVMGVLEEVFEFS